MPEKPGFSDKPNQPKEGQAQKEINKEKKLYATGRGEVISQKEQEDLRKRSWDEIK